MLDPKFEEELILTGLLLESELALVKDRGELFCYRS